MTTVTDDDIVDAEVVGRAELIRQAAIAKAKAGAEAAKAGATAGGKATGRGLWALAQRTGRGFGDFWPDLISYWGDVPGALEVASLAATGGITKDAKTHHEEAKRKHRANVVGFVLATLGWCTAGWTVLAAGADGRAFTLAVTALGAWAVAALVVATAAAILAAAKSAPKLAQATVALLSASAVAAGGVWLNRALFAEPGVAAAVIAVVGVWTLTVGATGTATIGVWKGKHKDGWVWPNRLGLAVLAAAAGLFFHVAVGWPAWLLSVIWAVPVVGWVTWAASDGEVFGDAEAAHVAAAPPVDDARDGAIVKAVTNSDARLPKDATLSVVAPGVMPLAGGKMWTVTLDTGGPDAGPIVAARGDVASRLGLSRQRLLVEQSKELGRRVRLTGIVQSPWGDPIPSPLIDAESFRFGSPIPYGPELVTQAEWLLPMFEMHYLIGGAMRRGKSTSCYPIYAAAALDVRAPVWIIDGGDVDTRPWHAEGVTRAWTTEPEEAPAILDEVIAEIEMRQDLLAQAKLVRPNDEFYAEHDMSDALLGFDEFAGFTNHPDRKLAGIITRKLVSIIQRAPKTNTHVVLSAQSPSAKAFDTDGRGVINGRAALLCDSPEMSDKIMGSGSAARGIDASVLDDTVKGLQVMSVPGFTGIIRPYLITPEQVQAIARRAAGARGKVAGGAHDGPPRVLVEMHRLLTDRGGRMLSREMAAAMRVYEIVDVTDADRTGGKTDEQILQEKLADLVRPHGVKTRPDPSDGNRMAYWLQRVDARGNEVGVGPALAAATKARVSRGASTHRDTGSRTGLRTGSRRLHVVNGD